MLCSNMGGGDVLTNDGLERPLTGYRKTISEQLNPRILKLALDAYNASPAITDDVRHSDQIAELATTLIISDNVGVDGKPESVKLRIFQEILSYDDATAYKLTASIHLAGGIDLSLEIAGVTGRSITTPVEHTEQFVINPVYPESISPEIAEYIYTGVTKHISDWLNSGDYLKNEHSGS